MRIKAISTRPVTTQSQPGRPPAAAVAAGAPARAAVAVGEPVTVGWGLHVQPRRHVLLGHGHDQFGCAHANYVRVSDTYRLGDPMAVYEGAVAGAQVLDMHVGSGGREHEVAPGDLGFVQRDVAAGAPEAQLPIEFELLSDPGPHAEDDGDQRW